MSAPDFLLGRGGRRLACRRREGLGPTILFLPGYMSDMEGTKALALDAWAEREGRAMLRFDYGGCGESPGEFEAQSLGDWRDDSLSAIDAARDARVVLVGSSMGGWLMLLAAIERPERVAGLVGIAAAPDFTSWGFSDEQKRVIRQEGRLEELSPHGEATYVTSRTFWDSGEALALLGDQIPIRCPVRLLHALDDGDVPWRISLELMARLRSADVQTILVKGGDHRLSRPEDLALLIATLERLLETL
jgi:pimeloyl-ACP methyl ester carboxylesterase